MVNGKAVARIIETVLIAGAIVAGVGTVLCQFVMAIRR